MRLTTTRRFVLAAAVLFLVAPAARAELIVGNLTLSEEGFPGTLISTDDRVAVRVDFDGSFAAHTLTSIVLRLSADDDVTAGLELFDDVGGQPGGHLADLGTAAVTDTDLGLADYTFTPVGTPILSPATSYWLVLRRTATDAFQLNWGTASSGLDPGSLPGASLSSESAFSFNAGDVWFVVGDTRLYARLDGVPVITAIPEPSTLALAAMGGAGLIGVIRRRKRA